MFSICYNNFGKTEKDRQRFSNIEPFVNNYNWEGISYLLKIED